MSAGVPAKKAHPAGMRFCFAADPSLQQHAFFVQIPVVSLTFPPR